MNATEARLKELLGAQAAAVEPQRRDVQDAMVRAEAVADVVSLDGERRKRRPGWMALAAVGTAAAVVAGVVFITSDADKGSQEQVSVVASTDAGVEVRLDEGLAYSYALGSVPDGFRPSLLSFNTDPICTRWTQSGDVVQCHELAGFKSRSYYRGEEEEMTTEESDTDWISTTTFNAGDPLTEESTMETTFIEGSEQAVEREEVTVDGKPGTFAHTVPNSPDDDVWRSLWWAEDELLTIQVVYQGAQDGALDLDDLLELAGDLEPSAPKGAGVALAAGKIDNLSGATLYVGAGGDDDAPCISVGFTSCADLDIDQDGVQMPAFDGGSNTRDGRAAVAVVAENIAALRFLNGSDEFVVESVAVPGFTKRFVVGDMPADFTALEVVPLDDTGTPLSDPIAIEEEEVVEVGDPAVVGTGRTPAGEEWSLKMRTMSDGSTDYSTYIGESRDDGTYIGGSTKVMGVRAPDASDDPDVSLFNGHLVAVVTDEVARVTVDGVDATLNPVEIDGEQYGLVVVEANDGAKAVGFDARGEVVFDVVEEDF